MEIERKLHLGLGPRGKRTTKVVQRHQRRGDAEFAICIYCIIEEYAAIYGQKPDDIVCAYNDRDWAQWMKARRQRQISLKMSTESLSTLRFGYLEERG